MVWAGDQSTDFDRADGLPAALVGALNVGMSGIPFWGSDISGYHFVYNPPPDKELYIRWTELGAFSADMHDENEGAGNGSAADRWQIWSDAETLETYKKYASYKTRMLPYVKVAVGQAERRGTPVMRHLILQYPKDPNVYGIEDEYMYGDGLLVAPVVTRGQRSRRVYLPEIAYFDFWTGDRVAGRTYVEAPAPLGTVLVYAKVGAIVPMLAPDVETLVSATNGNANGTVSAQERAGTYEVHVFAGGQTSVTLDDGTQISQTAPETPFVPGAAESTQGPIPAAASAADLTTCDACAWDDPSAHTYSIALRRQNEILTAGPLRISIASSPDVKRFVFVVRH
jgi:alpha-glucosidase (family GH31 glycosyl hydrolase)